MAEDVRPTYQEGESVICPACKEPVGHPCLSRDNRLMTRSHVVRIHAEEQCEKGSSGVADK